MIAYSVKLAIECVGVRHAQVRDRVHIHTARSSSASAILGVTEKAWHWGLEMGAIPVVYGGLSSSDYSTALPPNSFIDASGFRKVADLVAYLHRVATNESLFNSYHACAATGTSRSTSDSDGTSARRRSSWGCVGSATSCSGAWVATARCDRGRSPPTSSRARSCAIAWWRLIAFDRVLVC